MATLGLKERFTPSAEALDVLIEEASDWVEGYCDRVFAATEHIQIFRPTNSNRSGGLILEHWPVISIDSIDWENSAGGTGSYSTDLVWTDSSGVIEWKSPHTYSWWGSLNWTIAYTAGYDPIPSNVRRAVALKIANLMQPQYQGPQEREIFMVTNLEAMIIDLLEPFRRDRLG